MFPIFDIRSRPVGFGGRTWRKADTSPKYINSIENALYNKRSHLYGLNLAKDYIGKQDCALISEGYLDMALPFANGIKNIVASLGTSLTLEQSRFIKRYTKNIILIFDSDKAGQSATLRAFDLLLENDLSVKVVNMPDGHDPDSLIREKDTSYFLELIKKSVDCFDYKLDVLKKMYKPTSIDGKAKIAEEMLATISKVRGEVRRYEYIKHLASFLKTPEEVLLTDLKHLQGRVSPRKRQPSITTSHPVSMTEKTILRFMLTNNKAFEVIRKQLTEDDFSNPVVKHIVSFCFTTFTANKPFSTSQLTRLNTDKNISAFISGLLLEEGVSLDKQLLRDCIMKLKKNRLKNIKSHLREKIEKAENEHDHARLKTLLLKYKKINSQINQYG